MGSLGLLFSAKEKISKLLSISLIATILPAMVVGNLVSTAPIANAAQTINLEFNSGTYGTPAAVIMGSLASRSASTKANQKVLTSSGSANPFTMSGVDSLTSLAYTYQTDREYTSTNNLKESIDVTTASAAGMGFNVFDNQSYLTRTGVYKLSSTSTSPIVWSQNGTSYTQTGGDAFGAVFGPEIWSSPFTADTTQSVAFDWAAKNVTDDYEIYAFLVRISSNSGTACTTDSGSSSYGLSAPTTSHTLLAYGRGYSQTWTTASGAIPSNGCYRFRFIMGTYDRTGGRAVGAELYIDQSVVLGLTQTITFPQPNTVTSSDSNPIAAGASSDAPGATLTYTSNSLSVCTVNSSGQITILTTGNCSITVGSAAFGSYTAATSVSRVFSVTGVPTTTSSSTSDPIRILPSSLVTFAQNGADTPSLPQSEILGDTKALWKNIMTRAGYTFAGWNTKADGTGTAYADGAQFKFDAQSIILYAQWKLIQTKPTITWANPAAIQEGTALGATQLNALASVPGTYTYSPAAPTALAPGKHTLKVTFVPTDAKYETIETTVEIEVLAKAKVTWANPAAIQEGTPLSGTQLNATASVPGTYAYEPKDGAVLTPGKYTLKVTFTPTDSRLTPVTAEVTIEVTAKPVVIPAAPVSPTYSVTGAPKSTITWGAGKDAATYTVLVDGKNACSVAVLTCEVAKLLGPKNVVTVTSVATNGKTSAAVPAAYVAPAAAQVLSTVNFDSARAVIKSAEATKLRAFAATVKAAGYTTLTVFGHTDSVGGVDNQKLSVARANATITYLKKLLPGVTFAVSGFAASEPVADNSTAEGKAANRRAEIFIP